MKRYSRETGDRPLISLTNDNLVYQILDLITNINIPEIFDCDSLPSFNSSVGEKKMHYNRYPNEIQPNNSLRIYYIINILFSRNII